MDGICNTWRFSVFPVFILQKKKTKIGTMDCTMDRYNQISIFRFFIWRLEKWRRMLSCLFPSFYYKIEKWKNKGRYTHRPSSLQLESTCIELCSVMQPPHHRSPTPIHLNYQTHHATTTTPDLTCQSFTSKTNNAWLLCNNHMIYQQFEWWKNVSKFAFFQPTNVNVFNRPNGTSVKCAISGH